MTGVAERPGRAAGAPEEQFEPHRRELVGYCYRMLGSAFEAEDAVQDTMLRAWRAWDGFDGRSSVRSWLYRIATNVCLDALNARNRRALPMDLNASPSPPVIESLGQPAAETTWITPVPGGLAGTDPADVTVARETVRLAFVAALQHLPPKQRSVLVLREVLRWSAAEVAELLDTTVASVNSALQRGRATLAARDADGPLDPVDDEHRALLENYVDAFERYDMAALVALLHEDAVQSMPPFALWLQGAHDVAAWMLGPGAKCRGSRLVPVVVNGRPGFGQYRLVDGRHVPWAIQVVEARGGRITALHTFVDPALFPLFGLPDVL